MKKEYVKPRCEIFALTGDAICLTAASDPDDGVNALSKDNHGDLWEDETQGDTAPQTQGLWD